MPKALSIFNKQLLSKNSETELKWEELDSNDRKIVLAVCCQNSVENARKSLKLSIGGFYKRWQYLKPVYQNLLDDLPNQAINIMKGYSKKAAETLAENLDAGNASDQIKAANSILDRVTPQRAEIQKGLQRRITLEEFIGSPADFIQKELRE